MKLGMLSKIKILVFIFAIFVLYTSFLFWFIPQNSASSVIAENIATIPKIGQKSPGLPIYLIIPKINVYAPVIYVGTNSNGAMSVPNGPDEVAWFDLGIIPGDSGSSVIAGHFGPWKNGQGSVFDNLNKLKSGDKIYIEDKEGLIITFVVKESLIYNLDADTSNVFISNDGKPHLNLITCNGGWDKISQTYFKRLVVFTDEE